MGVIRTVIGDIAPTELGVTYPHEHLIAVPPPHVTDPDLAMPSEAAATRELVHFREAGGRALVEMTTVEYGRDVRALRRISEAVGVHVVATTGFIKEDFFRPMVEGKSVDALADAMIRDVSQGVDGTGICAGVIKAGSSKNRISPLEETVFRAAARAHRETGALVSTHTEAGTMALEQIDLLTSEGVPPKRVLIGHMDRLLDRDYHVEVAERGVCLGFDQFSKEKYYPDAARIDLIRDLVERGHGQQIILSGDLARRSYWPAYGGGPGLTFILWRIVPWLREEGVPQEAIDDMLVHTPARLLTLETA